MLKERKTRFPNMYEILVVHNVPLFKAPKKKPTITNNNNNNNNNFFKLSFTLLLAAGTY